MLRTGVTICLVLMTTATPAQDIDAAGPDFWSVSGLRDGSSLNVRAQPSGSAAIELQISTGTILRNLGCQGAGEARWCQVSSPDGVTINGYVSGRYLVESGPPPESDALVAGTAYNATGQLPCTLARDPATTSCAYGVIRASTGLASIFITLPGGDERLIEFRDGSPVAPPGSTATVTKTDDMTTVVLDGGAEIYTIADVVFAGD